MDQTTITQYTRRGLRNPRFSSTDITAMTLLGVLELGKEIQTAAPTFFRGRQILDSDTHVFAWPSDCQAVMNVWDTAASAGTITDATNASPINIEETAHGRSDDDKVLITSVGGNTAANGTWKITYVDVDNYTLDGSTGNAAYTSGGYAIKWSSTFRKMTRKNQDHQDLASRYRWYPEGRNIVIDYLDYSYDLIVDYIQRPDAITDIPSEYHMGLVAWNVKNLIVIPEPTDSQYQDIVNSYAAHRKMYDSAVAHIRSTLGSSTEAKELVDVERWDLY